MTLAGLAYTAGRLVELCREVAVPGVIVSLDIAQPVAAYRFLAAHLDTQGLKVPLHVKTPALRGRTEALFQGSIGVGTLLCDGLGDSLQIDSDLHTVAEATRLRYTIIK